LAQLIQHFAGVGTDGAGAAEKRLALQNCCKDFIVILPFPTYLAPRSFDIKIKEMYRKKQINHFTLSIFA
jgi:hypothetical protein